MWCRHWCHFRMNSFFIIRFFLDISATNRPKFVKRRLSWWGLTQAFPADLCFDLSKLVCLRKGGCQGTTFLSPKVLPQKWQLLKSVQLGTVLSICGNQCPKWPEMKNHFSTLFQYLSTSTWGQGMELSAAWIRNKCQHWLGELGMAVWTKGQSGPGWDPQSCATQ